jgi:hypothetical protein
MTRTLIEITIALHNCQRTFRGAIALTLEVDFHNINFRWLHLVPYDADTSEIDTFGKWTLPLGSDENALGTRFMNALYASDNAHGWKPKALVILADEMERTQEVEYLKIIETIVHRVQEAESA